MKIISIFNQKGGVGKTQTALHISYALGQLGKKILVVENDPQSNIRKMHPTIIPQHGNTLEDIYELEINEKEYDPQNAITNIFPGVDLMITTIKLAKIEMMLTMSMGAEKTLSGILEKVEGYDYCLIDNPPSLGSLTINSLAASDVVFIPMDTGKFALEGVDDLLDTIKRVRKKMNSRLVPGGVLLTRAKEGSKRTREVRVQLEDLFGPMVFKVYINECAHFEEALTRDKTVFQYEPKSGQKTLERARRQYTDAAKELIERVK